MSTPKLSQLIPLDKNANITSSTQGLLNPGNGRLLSTTPSPLLTPLSTKNLSSLGSANLPSLSPLPETNLSTSGINGVNGLPPLLVNGSSSPGGSGRTNIEQSLANLRALPPSPILTSTGTTLSSETLLPLSPGFGESNIIQSLANLNALPPSPTTGKLPSSGPSSPSLQRLPGFQSVSQQLSPITLPAIPATGVLMGVPDTNLKPLVTKTTTVEEGSPSTTSFSNYQGMLQDNNIENTLIESGFLPVDKILTKDDNGNLMCQYIKAIDETGRSAFVDLDCDGYVSVSPEDATMTEKTNASVVPYSVKMGTYECASSDVCGVAFECDNEICTLKRSDESLAPTETVFTNTKASLDSSGHKHHGMLDSHPISYPIVSMSDIKANPNQVACSIRDSHNRMRNAAFGQTNKHTSDLLKAEKRLQNEVSRYNKIQKKVSNSLNKTIAQLESIHGQYKKSPPESDIERENVRSVQFNLRKRHDMVVDYLKLSESVNSRVARIEELTGEIQSLNDYADKLFIGLDSVYKE